MNRIEVEKVLKRYLKKSTGYSIAILVSFLISGEVSLGTDINKEFQVQNLTKNIKLEKEEIKEKLLELEKELAIVKNSEDYSTHFLFSTKIEHRHAKKSNYNRFTNIEITNPDIDIPDIRDDIEPTIDNITNPLPNEDSIVKVPSFEFSSVGNVNINDKIPNIDLNLEKIILPKNDINKENFYILTDDQISKPDFKLDEVVSVGLENTIQIIKLNLAAPTVNKVVDLSLFEVKTINVEKPDVSTPDSFSLDTVKIKTGSFKQGHDTNYVSNIDAPAGSSGGKFYILQNYLDYSTEKNSDGTDIGLNVWVHKDGVFYDKDDNNKYILLKGSNPNANPIRVGHAGDNTGKKGFANRFGNNLYVTSFISDVIGQDTSVNGKYNYVYQGNRNKIPDSYNDQYVRLFFSNSSAGLFDNNSENIKITKFNGELNLSTNNDLKDTHPNINGYLIGIEHQLWDDKDSFTDNTGKNTTNLYSNLLNLGTINIGNNPFPNDAFDTNMIGIMIDLAKGTTTEKRNHRTINAGSINILNGKNSIGLSFEEYGDGNEANAMLRDDLYVGKINIEGDNTKNNYAFKMGNIYDKSSIYFDKTKIIGNLNKNGNPGSIIVENDNKETEEIKNYTSDIVVGGNQNTGIVVGKSLSSTANSNPIANFENISIKVDGNQTIGFVRDKNYSGNNTNDMIITDKNLNNVRFGANAKNSVLFRSEMYGITNESYMDITTKEKTDSNSDDSTPYNVVMQAIAQSWSKNGNNTKDINSSGSITNGENGIISGITDSVIGMMVNGNTELEDGINNSNWQNEDKYNNGLALATNKGTIALTGKNNIGMAIMDNNIGNNSGTIKITGKDGVGIYNTNIFKNANGNVNVSGENGIGIYNNNNLTLEESLINIGGENSVGVYSEGGTINFGPSKTLLEDGKIYGTTIQGNNNAIVGIYATKNISTTGEEEGTILKGDALIEGTKVGLVSDSGITKVVGGNIGYSGNGFSLQTINGGKIKFDSNSTLTLGGSAYGINIVDDGSIDNDSEEKEEKDIDLTGATIKIISNNVTLFNINGNGKNYSSEQIESGDSVLPGEEYLKKFVGKFTLDANGYTGYKMASIEEGNILLNSTTGNGNNEKFLEQYKFQRSKINMVTDTTLNLTNKEADTSFNGETLGIAISSTSNIKQEYNEENNKTIGEQQREETQINIGNSTLTANRLEKAPVISDENNTKSTIGAYIDYGVINLGYNSDFNEDKNSEYKAGHIVVENNPSLKTQDYTNNNGIGIFSKNGSKVAVNEGSSITVYGDNGIGIYGGATVDEKEGKNKFGGIVTQLNIENKGKIDISSGIGGVGIFADNGASEEKGTVINSGTITVNGGTENGSSVGIYGINVDITHTGNIQVGCQHDEETENYAGIGIYAQNSNITIGTKNSKEVNSKPEFTLGDYTTGIHLDGDSNLTLNNDLIFKGLNTNITDKIGIYAESKNKNGKDITINYDIDMSDVVGGKTVVVDGRTATLVKDKEIKISGNNGRGLRVLENGVITNEGKITIGSITQPLEYVEFQGASIGMVTANTNGSLANNGIIDIKSTDGIGIYVDNSDSDRERDGNQITAVGTINLNGDKNIGMVSKEFDLTFGDNNGLTTKGITFKNSNGIGIYSEDANITVKENIIKSFEKDQTNNILIASIGNENKVINSNTISLSGEGKNNIGVYLGKGAQYLNEENGSIVINNGNIGIYADKGSGKLENINIISDSKGIQTIGIILDGENKEEKIISGNINLTNTSNNDVQGKNIGIYAHNSSVVVNENDILTLHNTGSNGTGLYLNDSTLLGSGTVKITGIGKINSEEKIPNSVGIYYTSIPSTENKSSTPIQNNEIKLIIDKSNTIGVYVASKSNLTKQSTGGVIIGESQNVENVTGLVASNGSIITNQGSIVLGNSIKSIGLASLGGSVADIKTTTNNNGTIEISQNSANGTGIFLTGNSKLDNNGTIIINEDTTSREHLGIGIYTSGENATIGSTGNFDMKKGNIAIYSDGTNISSDINLTTKNSKGSPTNIGTTALVVKSDNNTLVGKEALQSNEEKMKITLSQGSIGVYALDNGVKISNISVDANAHDKSSDDLSYGIYLKAESNGNYEIKNTDISLVKGIGIAVETSENIENTKLTLSGSEITINSYSEGDEAETGMGIYTTSGKIALTGGNTINTSFAAGIFGGTGSDISIGATGGARDTLNLKGYSAGIYSRGGNITLGENTDIIFHQGKPQNVDENVDVNTEEISRGQGAYIIDGNLISSANIGLVEGNNIAEGIVGLLGNQSENGNKEVTLVNKGNIELSGNSVMGMAGIRKEDSTEKVSITNEGNIIISGKEKKLSTGIYGENTDITNNGNITVGDYAVGIYYMGTRAESNNKIINNRAISLSGKNNIGAFLNGEAGNVSLGNINVIERNSSNNLGVYLSNYHNYLDTSTSVGNIELGDESLGLYIHNSSTTINSIGNITAGIEGIGIASLGIKENNVINDNITITSNGIIEVGDRGTAIYVKDSNLTMDSLDNIKVKKDGALLHVNSGIIDFTNNTLTTLKVDNGNIGMILENGGDIKTTNGQKISNIEVTNGGTGILIKGSVTGNPSILAEKTTIALGSGSEDSYSVGVYYQNSDAISRDNKLNLEFQPLENTVHHTIGTIYDKTYGTINNFKTTMNKTTYDSIGVIIRRDGENKTDNDKNVILRAEDDEELLNVEGQHNIGIASKNSIIVADGDMKVGLEEESKNSIGVYLTGTDSNWKHSYTGIGNIEVGKYSYGIYAKNYDITHNGDITVKGDKGLGIVSVIEDKEGKVHNHIHDIIVGDKNNSSTITVSEGAIGIYGKDTNIDVLKGDLRVSGDNTVGIVGTYNGNITYNGNANISGKETVGIYKNTVIDNPDYKVGKNTNNTIEVGKGNWNINNLGIGVMAISRSKSEDGIINNIGESINVNNNSNMTLGNGSIGIYSAGANKVINTGNLSVGKGIKEENKTYTSTGIYMANDIGGIDNRVEGTNFGTITVGNKGGVGIQVAGYVDFTNNGYIDVSEGGEGIHTSYGASVTNTKEGTITVTGKGTGMIANREGSKAINNGIINLEKNDITFFKKEEENQYNTSLIGMVATNGGYIENNGTINVNDGIGMYVDKNSSLSNNGTIEVNSGIGILGTGELKNSGTIHINSSTATDFINKDLDKVGTLVINRENNTLEINNNFSNIGGILDTDYNINLNNPTIDITVGGAGFIAPNISGELKLDSNFALEGDGLSFSVEDFIKPDADVHINTSPLFKTDITEGDLTVNKVDYKDVTTGSQFDNRDNALDDILTEGGVEADILKNLNYYLDSLGNTTLFNSEANRLLGAVGGNIYSNIQSRMQDISRNFDSSFIEMLESENPTYENSKYHLIYTEGDYKNPNKNVINYNYSITGLNYMKEYDLTEQGKKYGYTFGFTGTKFKFDDFSSSKEDIYSLKGGVHRVNYFSNTLSWLTRAEIGYNHHRIERKINIPNVNIKNRDWFSSYQVSLDNRFRKELFANEHTNFGAYTALNLEYGLFDDIKEKGNLELKIKSNDYFSSKAMIGFDGQLSKPLNNNWSIKLNGDISYSYDFGNNYDENKAKFRNNGDYYSLSSELKSRDVISGKLSVALNKSDYMTISLHGQTSKDFRRDEYYWNVGLTFIYRFNHHAVPEKFLDMCNYFEFDKSELKADDKQDIKEMAEYIKKNNMKGTLLIEGHTDDRGSDIYNDKLSLKRANSVKKEFEKTLDKEDNIEIKVRGYGEKKPKYRNINESTRSKNRRAQVNILNK